VLVKVYAASVNQYDWHLLTADIFLIRLTGGGLLKPKNTRLGVDIAGRVEAVGRNVKQFHTGDDVFGMRQGGFAEYVCAPEDALALKPSNLSFEQAAAIPMAAVTALQGLRDTGQIQPGQKVLINGALLNYLAPKSQPCAARGIWTRRARWGPIISLTTPKKISPKMGSSMISYLQQTDITRFPLISVP
jgi:hypothetical protein